MAARKKKPAARKAARKPPAAKKRAARVLPNDDAWRALVETAVETPDSAPQRKSSVKAAESARKPAKKK